MNQSRRPSSFFCSDPTQYLISPNFSISIYSGIPACDEALITLANNSVRLKLLARPEQNNVADSEHVSGDRLDMHDLSILDGGQHAPAYRLKTKSIARGD
jgi:hypothetical protein